MAKNKKKEKAYRSMMEIEKKFFPKLHKERLLEKEANDPGAQGRRIARETLEAVKSRLAQ